MNKLVNEYNSFYHKSTKMTPFNASKKSNENVVRKNYNFKITDKKPKFSIGDKVRISLLKILLKKDILLIGVKKFMLFMIQNLLMFIIIF